MTLDHYLRGLLADGLETFAELPADVVDQAIALWIREHPEKAICHLEAALTDSIRWQRIAAMLATYHEACAARADAYSPLRRLGGLIAGAVFDNLRKEVANAWEAL